MKKWVIILLLLILSGCVTKTGKVVQIQENINKLEVYFCPQDECGEKLENLITSANKSVHCALFDLDLKNIKNSLKRNDIDVKIVTDIKNKRQIDDLNPVFNDGYQLMHNKFCVIDGYIVLTGSFNPTENDNFLNNNNVVIIESQILSGNYEDEFMELWNKEFGAGKRVKYPFIIFENKKIENYFCPEDECSQKIIEKIGQANSSVYFMTFSFTDNRIGDMLLRLNEDGIIIKGVFEKTQENNYSEYNKLKNNGIDVKFDNNKYNMHHKVFIIDNKTVITGSYNPTKSGDERNDENILIIEDEIVAKKFLGEFERVWNYDVLIKNYCTYPEDLMISEVYYDTLGKDSEEEYVEIYNPTSDKINLDYYFISDGKNKQKLGGYIQPKEKRKFHVKIGLSNSNGYLILLKGIYQKDFVSWEGIWKLETRRGEILKRKSFNFVNCEEEWIVSSYS
ncbi:MAG: phospholipase D-like domain-containing protein [Candidatus Aenigmatarchaeota archaeon]